MTSTDSTQDKELLERYRRTSDTEAAAPSEAVRAAILAEGRRVAAERANKVPEHAIDKSRPAANDSRWKITAFGTAGAAILAALLFVPRYWESQMAPMRAESARSAAPAPTSQSADAVPAPRPTEGAPLAEVAPMAKVAPASKLAPAAELASARESSKAVVAANAEPSALAPRKDLRIAPERPRAESIAPSAAAQNYAPTTLPAVPLTAAPAAPPVPVGGALSMSADRMAAARIGPPLPPLLSAAASGDIAQATSLLGQGAPVDGRDDLGRTPLMLAVAQGRLEVVRLLLDRGADPNAADNAGQTPLQLAKQKNLRDVAALLERAGAR